MGAPPGSQGRRRGLALALCLLAGAARAAARPAPPAPRLRVESRALKPGEMLLLVVEGQDTRIPPEASLGGRRLDFFAGSSSGTWLALAGLDVEAKPGPLALKATLRAPGGKPVAEERRLEVEPAAFTTQELTVEGKYVTPSKTDAERAESESSRLQKLFTRVEPKRLFEGRFDSPIPGAPSSRFGERRIFNGQPRAPHSGADLRAKSGVPVKAPAAGKVLLAGPLFYQGNTVVIDHGLGITTLYAHLSGIAVKAEQVVKKGQVIGRVGATGRVTGPHLHWALKWRTARVDPFSLTGLDLDARLKPKAADPLKRSAACDGVDLPAPPKWGKASGGLRARLRPLKAAYAPGEPVTFLVELQNAGKSSLFLDFVLEPAARGRVLGLRVPPARPVFSTATARAQTEQIKIPPGKAFCFEQSLDGNAPILADSTTTYPFVYDSAGLYSTATVRAGIWRGRVQALPAPVLVETPPRPTP